MKDLRELYQSVILTHSGAPHNQGPLADATHRAALDNPLCGDQVSVYLRLGEAAGTPENPSEPRICEARFEGEGCAICRASASMMTQLVRGKTAAEAKVLADDLARMLAQPPREGEDDDFAALGELVALKGLRSVPSRRRCGTLPWEALSAALAA